MKLNLGGSRVIENPSDDEIASALASVDRGDSDFVILDQTDLTYIQACSDGELGLLLEYQDGSSVEHFQSTDRAIPLDRATRAFQKYAKGDISWQGELGWRKMLPQEL